MKKLYEVMFIDEYDNYFHCGFHESLNDALFELNKHLKEYGDGNFKLKEGDLKVYLSTFGECFNTYLFDIFSNDENEDEMGEMFQSAKIVGFIWEYNDEDFELAKRVMM